MKPIPTLIEIQASISNDLRNKLNLNDNELKKVVNAFTSVQSAQVKLIYLYLADIQRNLFPDTADTSANGGQLERLGDIYLNRQPNPSTAGVYIATTTGLNGSIARSGLTFKSNDDSLNGGFLFVLDSQYIYTGSGDSFTIRALTPGTESALNIGDELTITEPVIGVDKTITILSITDIAKASEEIDLYRQNITDAIQLEPQGGSKTDYRLWSSDAQGVRRVFPYVKSNDGGTVQIHVEATIDDSTDGLGTPSAQLLTDVLDVVELDPDITKPIEERGRRPLQADIQTLSITLKPVDVTIVSLDENTPEIQANILTSIETFLYDVRPFIAGSDLARDKNDVLYSAKLQSVITDVLSSSNFFNDFTMSVDGNVLNSFTFDLGNIPYIRNIIYS